MLKQARRDAMIDELEKIAILSGVAKGIPAAWKAAVPSAGKMMARGARVSGLRGGAIGALAGGAHGGLSEKGTFLGGAMKGGLIGAGVGAGLGAGAGKFMHKVYTGTFKPNTFMHGMQRQSWRDVARGVAKRRAAAGVSRAV